jgi:hypothetical protein
MKADFRISIKVYRRNSGLHLIYLPAVAGAAGGFGSEPPPSGAVWVCLNVLPHPGLLPKEKEKRALRFWQNQRRDWPDGLAEKRKRECASPLLGERI